MPRLVGDDAPMRALNIAGPEFEYDSSDPEGFHAGMARLGRLTGAQLTGITVYELPPGQAICPYHYEYGEEERLLVVGRRPALPTPGRSRPPEPRDPAFFRP